jgi:hypothetical protein
MYAKMLYPLKHATWSNPEGQKYTKSMMTLPYKHRNETDGKLAQSPSFSFLQTVPE